MKLTYKPEGAEPKVWIFKPGKLLSAEAEAIEDVTGMSYMAAGEALDTGRMKALRAFVWIFLKRDTPTLRFDQVEICLDDLELDMDDDEKADALAELSTRTNLSVQQAAALAELNEWAAERPATDPKEDPATATATNPTSG